MNNFGRLIAIPAACACLCFVVTHCASPVKKEETAVGSAGVDAELGYRTSPYWIRKASAVKAGDWSVYFCGKADPPVEKSSAAPWSGTISGEILVVIGKSSVITCEELVIRPDGVINITGRSKTTARLDAERWQHLILP